MLDIIVTLAHIFRAANHELYMVGGTVRDLLLRRASSPDFDLATDARPDEIKRLVAQTHPDAIVTVGEQFGTIRVHYEAESQKSTTETIQKPTTEITEHTEKRRESQQYEGSAPQNAASTSVTSVGSAVQSGSGSPAPAVVVAETPPGVDIVEITTYRSDRYDPASRKPEVTFGDT